MKGKWVQPFLPILVFALPAPPCLATRVLAAAGILALVVALLAVVQPWHVDPPTRRQP